MPALRVHHLNCATMCALVGPKRIVCHCLLVESDDGLVLVDTGLGLEDVASGPRRLGRTFVRLMGPRLDREETAVRQVERLGFAPQDVRHIVMTHLDVDHAGGLPDFPHAKVHVHAQEHDAAMARPTLLERSRYRAEHFLHRPRWELHRATSERWLGFECVQAVPALGPDLLLVPLFGHTRGHCAIAVRTPQGWLLHAGDAYFHRGEMDLDRPRCPPVLSWFQRAVQVDGRARLANQERLRELVRAHAPDVRVFCAHDPVELERLGEDPAPSDRQQGRQPA